MLLSISSKPERKNSISKLLLLAQLYITATYRFLFWIVTSQTGHSGKDVMSTKRNGKDSL